MIVGDRIRMLAEGAAETFVPPQCGPGRLMLDATFQVTDEGLRHMLSPRGTCCQSADLRRQHQRRTQATPAYDIVRRPCASSSATSSTH